MSPKLFEMADAVISVQNPNTGKWRSIAAGQVTISIQQLWVVALDHQEFQGAYPRRGPSQLGHPRFADSPHVLCGLSGQEHQVVVLHRARERGDWSVFAQLLAGLTVAGVDVLDRAFDEAHRLNQALDAFVRDAGTLPDWRPPHHIAEDDAAHRG